MCEAHPIPNQSGVFADKISRRYLTFSLSIFVTPSLLPMFSQWQQAPLFGAAHAIQLLAQPRRRVPKVMVLDRTTDFQDGCSAVTRSNMVGDNEENAVQYLV